MNVQCLLDEGLLIENGNGIYMTGSYKDLLTFHNAVNPDSTITMGTFKTYAKRHNWKTQNQLHEDDEPLEDDYN